MDAVESRHEALVDVAARWREPDHPPREEAVAETLEAPNRWTEEALDYALNRWMQRLTLEALTGRVVSNPARQGLQGEPLHPAVEGVIKGLPGPAIEGFEGLGDGLFPRWVIRFAPARSDIDEGLVA